MGKKSKSDETPMDRLRNIPKWQWGMIFIMAGIGANLVMQLRPTPANTAEARGAALGAAAASLVFIIAGIVMIILHFVRDKRPESKKRKRR
jgi:hypothetical protein